MLYVTKLFQNSQIPVRATDGSAGYDLFSIDNYIVPPGRRVVVSTGVSVKLPPGTYGRIAPRSGLAVKHGLDTLAGVIDPDYTGEVKVVLQNLDPDRSFVIRPGYCIAQLILENFTVADVLEVVGAADIPGPHMGPHGSLDRGTGGFA